jgi:hypothetical protein
MSFLAGVASRYRNLGNLCAVNLGERERGSQYLEEALALLRAQEDPYTRTNATAIVRTLADLGVFAYPPETVYSFRGEMQKPPSRAYERRCRKYFHAICCIFRPFKLC